MATLTQQRVFNFSAGPAVLPTSVLEQARDELLSYADAGASVLEISHRSPQFASILADAQQRIAGLLGIGDTYEILFLQGGSRLQFSMVPMNFMCGSTADYVLTGSWGKKAVDEAHKEGTVNILWDGKASNYDRVPTDEELAVSSDAAYVYYTSNETIQGVQFSREPEAGGAPLICDASSDFLSRPVAMEKYGLLYACAQKNAGPAGVTIVVVRKDLLERCTDKLPGYCSYKAHADNNSLFNTPPTFGVYLVGLVAKWLEEQGGLSAMELHNREKADLLYHVIDEDGFYTGHAQAGSRSRMNVTFRLPSDDLQEQFIAGASAQQLCSLKGHRSVGGIRASIYNAMPLEGVQSLRDFMVDFRKRHG